MKNVLFLTLICSVISVSGCIRLPNAEKESDSAPVPIGDPIDRSAVEDNDVQNNAEGTYQVKFETSKGDFIVEVYRSWAPLGAERFYKLVKSGFYDDARFFRNIAGFMVQFGLNGDPAISKEWRDANIKDDPVLKSNTYGTITYAMAGPGTRTTQVFINFGDNSRLDADGFAPFGRVIEGMDRVENLENKYGEQPNQGKIQSVGNKYLNAAFPDLDYIKKATIISETKPGEKSGSQKAAEEAEKENDSTSSKKEVSKKEESKAVEKSAEPKKETTKADAKVEKKPKVEEKPKEEKKPEAKKEKAPVKEDKKEAEKEEAKKAEEKK